MEFIFDYIWPIISGLAVLAIAWICKRIFYGKKPESNSQKTTIIGRGNQVKNTIKKTNTKK